MALHPFFSCYWICLLHEQFRMLSVYQIKLIYEIKQKV